MKEFRELEERDMFYVKYGFGLVRFVVICRGNGGVFATSTKWLKSMAIFMPDEEYEREERHYCYIGKRSWLRYKLML